MDQQFWVTGVQPQIIAYITYIKKVISLC